MAIKLVVGVNDLATTNPTLAAEWHTSKNSLIPQEVSAGSKKVVWWLGGCGHEWEAAIGYRNTGVGCPYCNGVKLLVGFNDLATVNPELAAEWHPNKNGSVGPHDIMSKTVDKFWWQCAQAHYWDATVNSRNKGAGCPYCTGRRIWSGFNDLATINPELAAEWHPDGNGSVTPNQVGAGVRTSFRWLGKCGHEWEDSVHRRNKGAGCPYCLGSKLLTGFNDLATAYPALAAEWHPTENDPLRPEQVIKNSAQKIVWLGACGHKWSAQVNERTRGGNNCPHCSGRILLPGLNDLATTHPEIAEEWDAEENGQLAATDVTAKSSSKVGWVGKDCGHKWKAIIYNRTSAQASGCGVCAGKIILCGFNDLGCTIPELASQWHPTENKKSPHEIAVKAGDNVWWKGQCGHEWDARVRDRTSKGEILGCPICSGNRALAGFNDLATLNPVLAAQWHPNKNGKLTAEQRTPYSGKVAWWQCDLEHEWEAVIQSRSAGNNCPYCANKKVWVGFNDLATTNVELAKQWHPDLNGNRTAEQITAGSGDKVWWLGICAHSWEAPPSERSDGHGCSVCHGTTIEVGVNDLATVAPTLAAQWHLTNNGELTAQQVTRGSNKKVWWTADCGHDWESSPKARSKGQGCYHCSNNVSQAEKRIQEFLVSLGVMVESSNRKILKRKELDLWVPEHKVAIEFNGIHWHKEKYRGKDSHYDKWLACQDQGIQLIQIWEDDWNSNPSIIKKSLERALGIVSVNGGTIHDRTAISITETQARTFLNKNSIEGYSSGDYFVGLINNITGLIEAVMTLTNKGITTGSLTIVQYETNHAVDETLHRLLSYAEKIYTPKAFLTTVDNIKGQNRLYENAGFIVDKVLPPEYMYVVGKYRKFKESLQSHELALLSNKDRIWDAGKTRYRLSL